MRTTLFLLLVFVAAMNFAPTTTTATAQTLDDTGLWFAALGNGKLKSIGGDSTSLKWWFDAHYRLRDDSNGFNQSIIRPGLGIAISDEQTLWAGYGLSLIHI